MITSNLIEGHTIKICPADQVENLEVIHYGNNSYDPSLVGSIINREWVKPDGGLWTSPVDVEYGWDMWCEQQHYADCRIDNSFRLKFNAGTKIAIINSFSHLFALPKIMVPRPFVGMKYYLDFELLAQHIDAIWLTDTGQWATRNTKPMNLYGWDCESILIMNPDCCYQIPTVFPNTIKNNADAETNT